jgi:hypothetical protein
MTIFKNKLDGNLYTIYKNNDGTLTAFPSGKVFDRNRILKNCNLEDFVVYKIEQNKILGFI